MATDTDMADMKDDCQGATPEVRNAIYAAKLKNARARNLGADWEENAKQSSKKPSRLLPIAKTFAPRSSPTRPRTQLPKPSKPWP